MKKENILVIISVLLSILILLFAVYISLPKKEKVQPNIDQSESFEQEKDLQQEESIPEIFQEEIEEEVFTFTQSAWIPAWDFNNGFESLKLRKENIKRIHPVLYSLNSNGTLMDRKPSEISLNDFLTFTKSENITVIPTIGSYDSKVLNSVLSSDVYIEKNIGEILSEVEKYDFDGIDIDYEKIYTQDRDRYLSYLSLLSSRLKDKGKILSITVSAKTRDSSIDTLYAQDWIEINKIADSVNIMAYDYTLQTSTIPGPIGPIDWIQDVLEYSKGKFDSKKVYLGIHLYSYLWKGGNASALTYSSTEKILANSKIQREYKTDIAEGYASYTCSDGSKCILFYPTKEGIEERINISKEYNLRGVVYWRLGSDGNILDM